MRFGTKKNQGKPVMDCRDNNVTALPIPALFIPSEEYTYLFRFQDDLGPGGRYDFFSHIKSKPHDGVGVNGVTATPTLITKILIEVR